MRLYGQADRAQRYSDSEVDDDEEVAEEDVEEEVEEEDEPAEGAFDSLSMCFKCYTNVPPRPLPPF